MARVASRNITLVLTIYRTDEVCIRQNDITFALTAVLNYMAPTTVASKVYPSGSQNPKTMSELRTASMTYSARDSKIISGLLPSVYKISFLGIF